MVEALTRGRLDHSMLRRLGVQRDPPRGQKRERDDATSLDFGEVAAARCGRSPAAIAPAVRTRECGAFIEWHHQIELAIWVQVIAGAEAAFWVVLVVIRAVQQHRGDAKE